MAVGLGEPVGPGPSTPRAEMTQAQNRPWPPEWTSTDDCDVRAIVRVDGGINYFYNQMRGDDGQMHEGSVELRKFLDNLPAETRAQVEVGINGQNLASGQQPLRGDQGIAALERLATQMQAEEQSGHIPTFCGPISSNSDRFRPTPTRPTALAGGVRLRG